MRGRKAKRWQFRAFCEQIDAAEAILASKYLEAIERSILEKRVVTKERVRQLPDGSITREIIREHHPPNMGPAMWWIERRVPGFGRKVEHRGLARERFEGYFRVNERFRSLPDDLRPRGRCHCCQVFHGLAVTPNK